MKTDFQALETTKKGNAGEYLVKGIIERSGWLIYQPADDAPHLIDFLCHKPGEGLIGVDVKTYPRRWCCPDTGIDSRDFGKYEAFEWQHAIPVHLVWVDEIERAIYGGRLRYLSQHAQHAGGKVYFPLSAMRLHRHLFPDELAEIRAVSTVDVSRYQDTELFFPWPRVQAMAGR